MPDAPATAPPTTERDPVERLLEGVRSDCGAMAGLMRGDAASEKIPTVRSWLPDAHAARSVAEVVHPERDGRLAAFAEQIVSTQLGRRALHPAVAAGLAGGRPGRHGRVYGVDSGDMAAQGRMVPFEERRGPGGATKA